MGDRLVQLTVYENSMEVKILASMLEAYGIYVHAPIPLAGNSPYMPFMWGGIPVMVREADYEAAKALLEDTTKAEEV